MPDPHDVSFRPVAPPAYGLQRAFVAARRRRAAKAGTTGAAGVLALVLAATALGSGGSPTLTQEPLPPARDGGSFVGGLQATDAPTPPAADQPATGAERAVASAGLGVAPTPRPGAGRSLAPAPRGPASRIERAQPRSGPMTRTLTYGYTGSDLACPASKRSGGGPLLCSDVSAYADSTGTTEVTATICNVDTVSETVSFPSARELDLSVVRGGREVWRWSQGRRFALDQHRVNIPVGQCLTWTTVWNQRDATGSPMPKGAYTFVAEFDAEELGPADRRATYDLTYY
jgi:hypothetical protein